jgi:hypothetical protein
MNSETKIIKANLLRYPHSSSLRPAASCGTHSSYEFILSLSKEVPCILMFLIGLPSRRFQAICES